MKAIVIGAGLAGCEAAFQLAKNSIEVDLYEMRPVVQTGAHKTDMPAEFVCSNSLGDSASTCDSDRTFSMILCNCDSVSLILCLVIS